MADLLDSTLPPRAPRFVGVFDILGFKALVGSRSLDEVLSMYGGLVQEAHEQTRWPVAKIYSSPEGGGRLDIETVPLVIGSDTLFLWQYGSGGEHVQNFFETACLLVARSVRLGVPLRGGIAYGDCMMDSASNTFVGQPLIDAHLVEASQQWAGVALHETCFMSPIGKNLVKIVDAVEYEVPVKAGCSPLPWSLRWHAWADADLDDQLARLEAAAAQVPEAAAKLANARKFCADVPQE